MDENDKAKSYEVLQKEIVQSWYSLKEEEREKYREEFKKEYSDWKKSM